MSKIFSVVFICLLPKTLAIIQCRLSENGHNRLADCSNLGLKEIPEDLPSNIIEIDLSGDDITVLKNGSLNMYSLLTKLFLRGNSLYRIEINAFSKLKNLGLTTRST